MTAAAECSCVDVELMTADWALTSINSFSGGNVASPAGKSGGSGGLVAAFTTTFAVMQMAMRMWPYEQRCMIAAIRPCSNGLATCRQFHQLPGTTEKMCPCRGRRCALCARRTSLPWYILRLADTVPYIRYDHTVYGSRSCDDYEYPIHCTRVFFPVYSFTTRIVTDITNILYCRTR